MKKLIIVFTVILTLLWQGASSQNLIAVQNGGNPAFYTVLDSAIIHANNGDTLYLSGGLIYLPESYSINKVIHIVGVGHNPDSTLATIFTYIPSTLHFLDGSDGSSLSGIYLTGSIILGYGAALIDVDNIKITRCNVYDLKGLELDCSFSNTMVDNFVASENVIRGSILGFNGNLNVIANNIIQGKIECIGQSNIYKNNIFLKLSNDLWGAPIAIKNGIIENNIILTYYYATGLLTECNNISSSANSTFRNNFYIGYLILDNQCTNCLASMNIPGNYNDIFIAIPNSQFDYSDDYHLQNPSLYTGADGTQIGIYGGLFPWKEGSIPFNPHFQTIQIAPKTDSTGNLNVNIKVAAQDH